MKTKLLFVLLLLTSNLTAQDVVSDSLVFKKLLDSLNRELKHSSSTEHRIKTLNYLNRFFHLNQRYNDYGQGLDEALTLSERFGDTLLYLQAIRNKVNQLQTDLKYTESLALLDKALPMAERNKHLDMAELFLILYGRAHVSLQQYPQSIYYFLKAKKINDLTCNNVNLVQIYLGMSGGYSMIKKNKEAIQNILQLEEVLIQENNLLKLAQVKNSLGELYSIELENERALKYHNDALKLYNEMKFERPVWAYAYTFACIGYSYEVKAYNEKVANKLDSSFNTTKTAIHFYKKSLNEWKYIKKNNLFKLADDAIATIQLNIADNLIYIKKFEEARPLVKEGLNTCQAYDDIIYISVGYKLQSILDSVDGNFKSAYENYQQHIKYNSKLFNESNTSLIASYKNQNDVEKMQLQMDLISMTNKANLALTEKQRDQKRMAILFLIISLIASGVIIHKIRNSRKRELAIKLAEERQQISQDLHDQIGSTLSSIAIYSKVAQLQSNQLQSKTSEILDKISSASNNMIEEMSDIVWAIQPKNDHLGKLIQRIESYTRPLAIVKNMDCKILWDTQIEAVQLNMNQRKSLYLIAKEAINNAIKYSEAKVLIFKLEKMDGSIRMMINDDGIGFDINSINSANELNGNGLGNMQSRASGVKGKLEIESAPGQGTKLTFTLPIAE